jgi:Flp pilus assembly protein TadD
VTLRQQGRLDDAIYEHMRAVSLLHARAESHVNLGLALAQAQQVDWALRAFHLAAEMAPNEPFPHMCLANLYHGAKKDTKKAEEHAARAADLGRDLKGVRPAFLLST